MKNQWKSDEGLKKKAKCFLELARGSVVTGSAQLSELSGRVGLRVLGELIFIVNEKTSHSRGELIAICLKLLGSKAAHEKEIENIAWNCVQKSLIGDEALSDIAKITAGFFDELCTHVQRHYQYVSPNYVIQLIDSVKKLHIGPVEALLALGICLKYLTSTKNALGLLDQNLKCKFLLRVA